MFNDYQATPVRIETGALGDVPVAELFTTLASWGLEFTGDPNTGGFLIRKRTRQDAPKVPDNA